ncbi:MAG: hypothetical protein KDC44_16120, partial [Phaeodactylibacter sp.]|nr:hypothetical protein [Phaeodactylibacter sp.]
GEVEYYDEKNDTWINTPEYEQLELPSNLMFRKLDFARKQLQKQQIAQKLTIYPPYEANLLGYWILDYLEYPIFLQCGGDSRQPIKLVLVYDHVKESYALCYCTVYDDLSDFFIGEVGQKGATLPLELELLIKEEVILEDASLDNILEAIKREGGNASSVLQF